VKKGDKNELEREKFGEQERGKIEYKEMEPPIIEKRGDKRPMSEPRHENQNQKRLRTVISETIHCVGGQTSTFPVRFGNYSSFTTRG
jgi:hypothetical protein